MAQNNLMTQPKIPATTFVSLYLTVLSSDILRTPDQNSRTADV